MLISCISVGGALTLVVSWVPQRSPAIVRRSRVEKVWDVWYRRACFDHEVPRAGPLWILKDWNIVIILSLSQFYNQWFQWFLAKLAKINHLFIYIYIHCQFIALVTILEALFSINSSVGQDHSVDVRELSHARVCLKKAWPQETLQLLL
jgi:hypothetical protein